ncbi:unnamed protein product [Cuscuta epithymum]|uniref:Kinesin motor domain-containing protein n=1 Tax=Cuscuta epithymum TaxID=186058 RepID=A0AAV0DG87_9ASTE|nr:unnamed protein product [Cuscuta epithymum]
MSARPGTKSQKPSSRVANSPASATTSSSKQFRETYIDCATSPAASSSVRSKPRYYYSESSPLSSERSKENVTVTVRFRPLSPREIRQGEEIAWYADGDTAVRNEHNQALAYAYDRVFGPTTTTRQVYDVAAQHVVSGSMEGINGTIFAYGVTSSGKTHTMHGDQRSPGIIPLAVKDAFSIIQETPSREYLLRVSYLEIYNEVVNDLLNPAGQNLRIREDAQGTFVEGIKEEVVLSPAHALSLIAAGEEHRHVGSTNFNLLSSRSHTIFTLTVESSPCENSEGEAVSLSQLHLIDLAGSESSKAETTGVRRKEGSYINKSLLTLGTVISKLTDEKAAHIPYRDSKLTRLLQSSLSGHGRVSLICTVTPSSSNSEETHNTLKFAHRAKHIEIQAAQNKIIDEKSLIKKYQNEILHLKEELEQLKKGIVTVPQVKDNVGEEYVLLKQKLEDGQVRLQTRLEQEEEAKAALLGRIQRLTKLILVSSKASQSSRFPHHAGHRRRHSFGEEELAYLPHRRRDLVLDDDDIDSYCFQDNNIEMVDDTIKEGKKTRKNGLLNWLKPRKREGSSGTIASTSDKSSGLKSNSTPSTPQAECGNVHMESLHSNSLPTENNSSRDIPGDNFLGPEIPMTSIKTIDQLDLLREKQKILLDEVALHTSALKRLSDEAFRSPNKELIQVEIRALRDDIKRKNEEIASLGKQISNSFMDSHENITCFEDSLPVAELMAQLNEKSFELEVKAADNRIIQEQLNQKTVECEELQETIASLKQLSDALNSGPSSLGDSQKLSATKRLLGQLRNEKENPATKNTKEALLLQSQAIQLEELQRKVVELTESKDQLEIRNHKLAEESSYAKGLASAAAVELKALSEEVSKLMNQNERLSSELAAAAAQKSSLTQRRNSIPMRNGRRDNHVRRSDQSASVVPTTDIKKELSESREREALYEAALAERDRNEAELQRRIDEAKEREAYLENELANMWVKVATLKNAQEDGEETRGSQRTDGFDVLWNEEGA